MEWRILVVILIGLFVGGALARAVHILQGMIFVVKARRFVQENPETTMEQFAEATQRGQFGLMWLENTWWAVPGLVVLGILPFLETIAGWVVAGLVGMLASWLTTFWWAGGLVMEEEAFYRQRDEWIEKGKEKLSGLRN